MKNSLMKLNHVSTFSGKGQVVILSLLLIGDCRLVGESVKNEYPFITSNTSSMFSAGI
jgi:hypothetical protein